jgi:ABC-type cobalamin transport system ATPase subunit
MRDIVASQSGHEVISLQKMDSLLLILNVTEKLRRFLRRNAGGIWIKIHLNPNLQVSA